MKKQAVIIPLVAIAQFAFAQPAPHLAGKDFTESFGEDKCEWTNTGRNQYFTLEPNYQLTLQGMEEKDTVTLVITVLNETMKVGNVETRIVEERESANGVLVEISRNFFSICKQTNSVFYFGEDVDNYKDGKVTDHEGSWRADMPNCKPGVMMPGMVLLGARYYQEVAPKIAMDRAEIISTSETMNTPAGNFTNVLKTEETNALKPKEKEFKFSAPNIGLIKDGDLILQKYGFVK